jgi:hypothetical protein
LNISRAEKRRLQPRSILNFITFYLILPLAFFALSVLFWPILGLTMVPKFYHSLELGQPALKYEVIIFCCFALKFILSIFAFFAPEILGRNNTSPPHTFEENGS